LIASLRAERIAFALHSNETPMDASKSIGVPAVNPMLDMSRKWLFYTATALICALSFAGSRLAHTQSADPLAPAFGAPRQLTLPPSFLADAPNNEAIEGPDGTASVVPNARSCPAAILAAILTPSGAHKAIPGPSRVTGAALGTGAGCPPTNADTSPVQALVAPLRATEPALPALPGTPIIGP
jgi:hypothetical protein